MPATTYDFLVLIGRFQPFHRGHLALVEAGLKKAANMILVCGSTRRARSIRNPWTLDEREAMIRGALSPEHNQRVRILGVADHRYDENAWLAEVKTKIDQVTGSHRKVSRELPKLAFISQTGQKQADYSTYFSDWDEVKLDGVATVSGAAIRAVMLAESDAESKVAVLSKHLSPNVAQAVSKFLHTPAWRAIVEEQQYIAQYKRAWSKAPYPPTFVTVDALVVQGGQVLLVERKGPPGKGLLALPGGFVGQQETLFEACLRELEEETGLELHASVLKQAVGKPEVFDDPFRSVRGRTITHVFVFELAESPALPVVHGRDDARRAFWLPLEDINSEMFFEDHYDIMESLLGLT